MRKGQKHTEEFKNFLRRINLGKKLSEEHKKKISESLKGHRFSDESIKKMSDSHKGQRLGERNGKMIDCLICGKKFYVITCRSKKAKCCSKSCLGKYTHIYGKKVLKKGKPNYKLRLPVYLLKVDESKIWRMRVEYRLWREAVFARDNWTCQKCNMRGKSLHPHHIFNFSSYKGLRFAIDNGITFCINCHKKFHHLYGNKNNNNDQLNSFLNL